MATAGYLRPLSFYQNMSNAEFIDTMETDLMYAEFLDEGESA